MLSFYDQTFHSDKLFEISAKETQRKKKNNQIHTEAWEYTLFCILIICSASVYIHF